MSQVADGTYHLIGLTGIIADAGVPDHETSALQA